MICNPFPSSKLKKVDASCTHILRNGRSKYIEMISGRYWSHVSYTNKPKIQLEVNGMYN